MRRFLMALAFMGLASVAWAQEPAIRYTPNPFDTPYRVQDGFGGYLEYGVNTELVTIAAAPTTDTTSNILPLDSVILAVTIRVITTVPTAATLSIGDATTTLRFASVTTAAGSVTTGVANGNQCNFTANSNAASCVQAAAAKIRITPNAQPADATGTIRIVVYYRKYVAPAN